MQVIPVAGQGVLDLAVVNLAGQFVAADVLWVAQVGVRGRAAGGGEQGRIAAHGIEAVDVLEGAVGEQDLAGLRIGHVHGRIQAVDDGDETLMRPLQFDAHPFRLGDVVHRGHPADLLAVGVDERREVEADIETLAVLAHDAHLETAVRRLARQRGVDVALQLVEFFIRPVGVGWPDADQFALAEAGHPAKRRIDEGDRAVEVDGAQAGDQRVGHRLAEGIGGAQFLLGGRPAPGVATQLDQGYRGDHGQRDDQRGRQEGQPGAAAPVGDDIQAEPVIRQFDVDGAGQLAVGRLDRTVAEHLAIVGADHGQAVAGSEHGG